jgi:hypothetical protein
MIRIDMHPTKETRPTCHMPPTLSLRMVPGHTYLTRSTVMDRATALEKKASRHNPVTEPH